MNLHARQNIFVSQNNIFSNFKKSIYLLTSNTRFYTAEQKDIIYVPTIIIQMIAVLFKQYLIMYKWGKYEKPSKISKLSLEYFQQFIIEHFIRCLELMFLLVTLTSTQTSCSFNRATCKVCCREENIN